MAWCHSHSWLLHNTQSLSLWKWKSFTLRFLGTTRRRSNIQSPNSLRFSPLISRKGYCNTFNRSFNSASTGVVSESGDAATTTFYSKSEGVVSRDMLLASTLFKREEKTVNNNPSYGRVMLIDDTSIIYRAYYKLLAKLHHGHLSHADGNGDWVLTIFFLIADS
ncbi:hypothetical protein ACFX13_025407 [Malus domestica]